MESTIGLELLAIQRLKNARTYEFLFSIRGAQIFHELAPKSTSYHTFYRKCAAEESVRKFYFLQSSKQYFGADWLRLRTPYQALGLVATVVDELAKREMPLASVTEQSKPDAAMGNPIAKLFLGDTFTHCKSTFDRCYKKASGDKTFQLIEDFEYKLLQLNT